MAIVTISSGAAITFTAEIVVSGGTVAKVTPTSHIITYDLSALGPDPVIQNVYLKGSSSRSNTQDHFSLKAPYSRSGYLKLGETPTTVNEIKQYMTGGTLSLTIMYVGGATGAASNHTYTFSTNATFDLVVELKNEPVVDRRSSGSLSADSVNFGQNITFTIEPFSATYQHQIVYSVGNYTARSAMLGAGVTSCIFSPPLAWVTEVPNSDIGTMKVLLDTQKPNNPGDPNTSYTSVGVREYSVQVNVPSNLYPGISDAHFEVINPSTMSQNIQSKKQVFTGISRIKITLDSISGSTGASIASISYSGWGETVTTKNPKTLTNIVLTTNVVRMTGHIVIHAVVTDSRGRQIGVAYDMGQAIEYSPPSFASVPTCERYTVGEDEADQGAALKVLASFTCDTSAIAGNTVTAHVSVKPYNSETWSPENGIELTNGVERILTAADIGYKLSRDVSYDVRFVLEDKYMAVEMFYRVPSLQYALHFAKSGRAVGIGKQAETLTANDDGRLDVNPDWTVTFGSKVYIGSQTLAEYIRSIVSAM